MTGPTQNNEFLSPENLSVILNVPLSKVYFLLKQNQIRSVRLGRIIRIPRGELDRFVSAQLQAQKMDA